MKKSGRTWLLLIAAAAAVCAALAVCCLRERGDLPAAEFRGVVSGSLTTSADAAETTPEKPVLTEPKEPDNGRGIREALDDLAEQFDAAAKRTYPVVRLKTNIYPDFIKAGLDEKVSVNPLHPCHRQYAMLFDSESLILSEPVRLSEMPEGYDSVTLWFAYDPERVGSRLSRMQVMRFEPDSEYASNEDFEELTGAETDTKQQCIRITVNRPGVYYVCDTNSYRRLWGIKTDIPFFYRNPTVGFETEFPAEVMFMQYMVSFNQIEESYLPDEIRWYDNSGARHIAPLMFTKDGTDPGIYDFQTEWITECKGADAAADAQLEADAAGNRNGGSIRSRQISDESGTLPDGTYRRMLVTAYEADDSDSSRTEMTAFYDLKPGEIIKVHYVLDPAEKDRLYPALLSGLGSFRKTGTALQEP